MWTSAPFTNMETLALLLNYSKAANIRLDGEMEGNRRVVL